MDTDYDIPKQDSTFRLFLENNQIEYVSSLAERYRLYKSVWPYHESGGTVAQFGDIIYISYSGYLFAQTPSTFGQGSIFTTNIAADTVGTGWKSNELLPLTPAFFILGSGSTLRGIDLGLEGSAKGDTVRLYLNADLAYGDKSVGLISPGTPVVFKIYIEDIRK